MNVTPSVPRPDPTAAEECCAVVYDLAAARERRAARLAGEIPAAVWAEVEAANRLFEELESEGRRIVFDKGRLDGRLVVSLCDLEGRVLRAVRADEVVGAPLPQVKDEGGAA